MRSYKVERNTLETQILVEINLTFLIPVTISNPLSFIKLLYRDILNWLNVLMQAIQEVRLYKREQKGIDK